MNKPINEIKIIKSELLSGFDKITHGFSTKSGGIENPPYYFNMSLSVGQDESLVLQNRKHFLNALGIEYEQTAFHHQVHGDKFVYADKPGWFGENDAFITKKNNIAVTVSSADCVPVFIYDYEQNVIATVHSGWRGTQQKIVLKVLKELTENAGCNKNNMVVFTGPAISTRNYEVGEEVASLFEKKYVHNNNNKLYLDVTGCVVDMIKEFGIPDKNLEVSPLCSYDNEFLHSYRREGKVSGRAMGVIMMKD